MQSVNWSRSKGYIVVGAIGICLSVLYLALSFQMPMGRVRQPGAGVFPVISGFLLLLGSVSALGVARGERFAASIGRAGRRPWLSDFAPCAWTAY